jgi:hypothetical protein
MEYEESIGFVMRKMKKYLLIFTLGLFMAKKHVLNDKKIPSVTRRRCRTQNLHFTYSARNLKIWLLKSFGPTLWEIEQNRHFIQFCLTNFTPEQI